MAFYTDKQTLDELNLLGKYRSGSIFHLFNHVKTRGGEKLLDDMFQHPLTDVTVINKRTDIFRFFQTLNLSFPFDEQQVINMREYLDTSSGSNRLASLVSTLSQKCLSNLTRDERYKKKVQGLQAVIGILHHCMEFVSAMPHEGPFAHKTAETRRLLEDPVLKALGTIDIYQTLSLMSLAHYDYLLKSTYADKMESLLLFIYEVDVYIAVSKVAAKRGFGYAHALPPEANILTTENLTHPSLTNAIGNDLTMDGRSNVLFLTGANMAGKSTLMKSVAIALYLAHMGFPVAATKLEFSLREGLYTSINVADNIGLGYSHFYAEVVRVKQAAEATASGKRLFLLFDELFKGTNVKDAYDGTLAVTEAFATYQHCLFVVSTHIIEVGEALKGNRNIHFAYMPTVMEGSLPKYTYRLKEGITADRQGMMIIRNEGILDLIYS